MSTRKRTDDDFTAEIRAHLELETARLVDEGMSADDARRAALRRFGSLTAARERFHESGRVLWLDRLAHDARCALRNMRRYPVAATVAIASLAAGIGATTVTLTVRDVLFYKAPPLYRDPDRLSKVQVSRPERPIMPIGSQVPGPLYSRWRDALGSNIAGSMSPRGAGDIRTADRTETAVVRPVTPEFFAVLGVSPLLGRSFDERKESRSGGAPAILSYRVWQRVFDERADVIGRTIWIDEQPHVIVGVMPERFWFANTNSPIWTELDVRSLAATDEIETVVRRPPGVTPEMLAAQLHTGLTEYADGLPAAQRQLRLKVSGIAGTPIGNSASLILPYLLGASVLLTLLIACANAAVLMIAQWTAREHEIAIRASIGASRGRVIQLLLTESILVAACGATLGVCATFALRGWIASSADTTFFDFSLEPHIFVQTAIIALLTGIAAGIGPALYETRRLHVNPLRAIASSDRVRQRWRHTLVVVEIMVTVALLVETAAMVDGYQRARRAQLGFATAPLMTARVENPNGVPTTTVLETLGRIPGVAASAASTSIPHAAFAPPVRISADAAGTSTVAANPASISADFFSTLGVQLRAGRVFARQDSAASRLAVVNETLARRLNLEHDRAGARIWMGGAPYDVIGIVADYSNNPLQFPESDPRVFVLLPADSKDVRRMQFLIRAEGDPAALVQVVRRVLRDVTPGTAVTSAYTIDQVLDGIGREILIGTAPLFPLVTIGMLLTTAGIYGVLAFAVARRSRELAVRMAIGATAGNLVTLISAQSLRLVGIGASLGIAMTFALSRIVRAAGGAGSLYDPPVQAFVAPVVIVLVIGVIATWVPSRRARKIDPAVLLRIT
jgi:predicted permease